MELAHNLSISKWNLYLRNTYYGNTTGTDVIRTAQQIGDFQFVYSRATSQFGLNGRYIFARASFKLF